MALSTAGQTLSAISTSLLILIVHPPPLRLDPSGTGMVVRYKIPLWGRGGKRRCSVGVGALETEPGHGQLTTAGQPKHDPP
jgi:hypothetical protein